MTSILVIDDEEIMREILEALLVREGYEVRLAPNAAVGLEQARAGLDLLHCGARHIVSRCDGSAPNAT